MTVRAIRGATQLLEDSTLEMDAKVAELVEAMLSGNGIVAQDLISILFTATPDLKSGFPAASARILKGVDLSDVPLICAQEIGVTGALPRVVRVLVHVNSDKENPEISHIYLHGAKALRKDIAGDEK
jgi:chorismate mutase